LIFIFLCSHELEKDFIKKKMKSYGKVETESKIAIKKIRFSPVMKTFSSMKMNKKIFQEKPKKLNEKEEDLVMK